MQGISELINNKIQEWKVPGVGIAIVQDSQIIVCEGFGMRNVEKDLKVTPKTVFAIVSCTKSFTTMALGILVDRGQLSWDKPVKNYLPNFKLFDPYATDHITPRDLVTHRCGLPGHDAIWSCTPFTRQEIFERLQYLEPNHELRTVFQYQNLMYVVAGYLVEQISNSSWEEFVQQEILNPLSMENSNFSVLESQTTDDFALPYRENNDDVKEIPFRNIDAIGPAGSINSNVTDMARWLLLHLNQGKYDDKQIISPSNLLQMHTPQIALPSQFEYPEVLNSCYGLGWINFVYRGHNLIQHGGGIDGFSALCTLMPQYKIGIVILTNLEATPLPSILTYNICDRLLDLNEVNWNERLKNKLYPAKEAVAKIKEVHILNRKTGTSISHSLEDYVGDFENPAYGKISIIIENDGLIANLNNLIVYKLNHYHYDTFEAKSEIFDAYQLLSFFTDSQGNINSLSFVLEPAIKDILFSRIVQQKMKEASFLGQFVGEYELSNIILTISFKQDKLVLSAPNQPDYDLLPYTETDLKFNALSGFSIKFLPNETGVFTEALITQPNGVFNVKKRT